MINRELIRLKAVQLVYAYNKHENSSVETAEKEFAHSLDAAYELYKYQLALLVEVFNYAGRREHKPLLTANKALVRLTENKTLADYRETEKGDWIEEPALVKSLYEQFVSSEVFNNYVNKGDTSFEADREVLRRLYKTYVCGNDELADILEAHNLYWNDDKDIVDSFILKTIKRLPAEGEDDALLPKFASQDDKAFATELFHRALTMQEQTRELIREHCKNWEFERLAFMDVVIAEVALTEMLSFPTIPVGVTLNEYIEIARYYSTPQSPAYINGLLDAAARQLKAEGKLLKA